MKIHYLGHSEFILELPCHKKPVSLLCDSWLSDYAFGDFMARNPSVTLSQNMLHDLDGIFISHPHCDHLDPYTLMEIYRHSKPDLIIPESMIYLKETFENFLKPPGIIILKHNETQNWKGISLTAFAFQETYSSNESDVMPLLIEAEDTVLFHEVDCAVPESADAWNLIYSRFKNKKYKNRIYIATRNELEALFTAYDAESPARRKSLLKQYRQKRKFEMEWEYEKFDSEEAEYPELWVLPGMIKIFTGQGMIHSPILFPGYETVSAPFSLSDILTEEKNTALQFGRTLNFSVQKPGRYAEIENGKIAEENKTPYLESIYFTPVTMQFGFDGSREIPYGPIFNESRNIEKQKILIENVIRNRFFPFQITNPEEPLKDIIHRNKSKSYTIEVIYGTAESHTKFYYSVGLGNFNFEEKTSAESFDESYWANDLEDFIEGKQDMFSTTFHRFQSETSIRLWTMLGMPYLNSDLVYKKINFHFQRAEEGKTVQEWLKNASQKFENADL
ncbi:MAG: hypothetical protein OEZ34_16090 [Spirochaetia bacterium]|nr:hypothetical protein [Spirochaetia bacterium]